MRWKNALVLMRKDLAEFRKQKFVIGSIIAMPIVLGVILPIVIIGPLALAYNSQSDWDVEGLVEVDTYYQYISVPLVNRTIQNFTYSLNSEVTENAKIVNSTINRAVLKSCILENSTIKNSTIIECELVNCRLLNVVVYHSTGEQASGKNILTIGSTLEYKEKKRSKVDDYMPNMINFVLVMFIILPTTLPTLIASYSIVGEKNNKSLEPLLATPTTDSELLIGKILSAFVPTIAATFLAFVLSISFLYLIFGPLLADISLPLGNWFLTIILLAPIVCIMSILSCVMISSRVKDVRAAQQLGGFVVIPVFVILIAVMTGFIFLGPIVVVLIALIFAFVDIGLFYFAKKIFNREDILTKWV